MSRGRSGTSAIVDVIYDYLVGPDVHHDRYSGAFFS
mgnify:CR=1 FL=1